MLDNEEVLRSSQTLDNKVQTPEQDKSNKYADILLKEATLLISRYLPEVLPQEPTEIFIGVVPQYIGKFKGKHCISFERDSNLDPMVKALEGVIQATTWFKEQLKLFFELEDERIRLIVAKAEKGEFDFEEIDRRFDRERELVKQKSRLEVRVEPKDQDEPEKLLKGPSQYSVDSWRGVYMLVHELIHQKQAELNPAAFPVLTSPRLDSIDPEVITRDQLYDLLIESHKAHSRTESKSIFDPVIEGIAVLGAFYVMGKFADDLAVSDEKDAANKIRAVRKNSIHQEVIASRRKIREGNDEDYDLNYAEGFNIMRKLYKRFGLENLPKVLAKVDLVACQQITKGSPEYQQIIENPALLPGLHQTT